MTPLVLGADGGATKTLAIIADGERHVVARQQAGASNPNVVGVDASARVVADLILLCCREAGCTLHDLRAITLGLAGAGGEDVRPRVERALSTILGATGGGGPLIFIESDARIALEGAFGGGPGMVIIAGTGSVVAGKTPEGDVLTIGGWGRVLGDEGSAYFIGQEALRALARDFDGGESSGALRDLFKTRFGWSSRDSLIHAVVRENLDIPPLAPLVMAAAAADDAVATGILRRSASLLACQADALAKRIAPRENFGAVLCGGLIDSDTIYARMLREELLRRNPQVVVQPAHYPPAQGAVLMALDRLGKGERRA